MLRSNPFNPSPGAIPSTIAGRDSELAAIREMLRRAAIGERSTPAAFIGQRGMGKSALLNYLHELTADTALCLYLEIVRDTSLVQTVRERIDKLLERSELPSKRAASLVERGLRLLPRLSYELPNDAGAIAVTGSNRDDEPVSVDHSSLVTMLDALYDAARVSKRSLLITIDEVQDVDLPSMRSLAAFVNEFRREAPQVLLALGGLDDTHDMLAELRTYARRWETFDLAMLTRAQTTAAINDPIVASGRTIAERALIHLVDESAGYPFFVQAFARAAWDANDDDLIGYEATVTAVDAARQRLEGNFYIRPLARLSARELAFVLALADLGSGAHPIGAVADALGTTSPRISSIRTALLTKHVVMSPTPGTIQFRTPLTDRFLRERRDLFDDDAVARARESIVHRTPHTKTR